MAYFVLSFEHKKATNDTRLIMRSNYNYSFAM